MNWPAVDGGGFAGEVGAAGDVEAGASNSE